MSYRVHGAYENPKKAKQFARFTSRLDYATREEAEALAEAWKVERDYKFIWIEGGN